MYGKHFESMYEGSMYGAGLAVFAVWGYVISHMREGCVELNSKKLSDTLGGSIKDIDSAIEYLQSPDSKSRNKAHNGRRLIKQGEYQYFVPSWEFYHNIRKAEERREYNRIMQREHRSRKKIKPPSAEYLDREQRYAEADGNGEVSKADAIASEGLR